MHRSVAVKKLTDPFKTVTVAKHMFREIKLLKQLQHENVCLSTYPFSILGSNEEPDCSFTGHLHLFNRRHVCIPLI